MRIQLDRDAYEPLYLQIHHRIRDLILSGDLPAGTRLPPERKLAEVLDVNRTTVSSAYQELAASGLVEGCVGYGTVVCALPTGQADQPFLWRDYFDAIGRHGRYILSEAIWPDGGDFISFAFGVTDPVLHPVERFAAATDLALRKHGAAAFDLGPVAEFHEALCEHYTSRGIDAAPENVLVLSGGQQGLDLIARAFITPGDAVIVERPTYTGAIGAFREAGAQFIEIPMDEEGMRLDALERALRRHKPQLIYTMPTFHHPAGTVMSARRREALLQVAQRYQVPIVEDDAFGDLYYREPPPPTLKSLDRCGYVIYLSTFSKTVFSGLRLGWIVAPQPVIERLMTIKQYMDWFSSTLYQFAMAEFIRQGWLEEHLSRVRGEYAGRMAATLADLRQCFPDSLSWSQPNGGFFIWCRLAENLRARDLLDEAKGRRLFFLTGDYFYANEGGQDTFRLNAIRHNPDVIREGIRRLAQALESLRA